MIIFSVTGSGSATVMVRAEPGRTRASSQQAQATVASRASGVPVGSSSPSLTP